MLNGIVPLRERILQKIGELGSVPVREIGHYFDGIDRGGLDVQLTALVREEVLSRDGGYYSLSKPEAPRVPGYAEAIPTAEEETAAALKPEEQVCCDCQIPKPLKEFHKLNHDGTRRAKRCNSCQAAVMRQQRALKGDRTKSGPKPKQACQSGPGSGEQKVGAQTFVEFKPVYADTPVSMPRPGGSISHECHTGTALAPGKAAPETYSITMEVNLTPLIRQQRQDIAKQIELARVALDNLVAKKLEYDQYLELHERLAAEVSR